jgi:hypothetical protein
MAQRRGQRAKRPSDRETRAREGARPAESIDALLRERDALRSELLAANAQIAALVARQRNVLDRIDWVIDSLNSLTEGDS